MKLITTTPEFQITPNPAGYVVKASCQSRVVPVGTVDLSSGTAGDRTGSTAAKIVDGRSTSPAAHAAGSSGQVPTRSTAGKTIDASSYPGGKSGAGVWQRLISMVPPHRVLIVPFAGQCGITRRIRPADHTIVIDRDPDVCEWWHRWQTSPSGRAVEIHCADGIEWLRHRCRITQYRGANAYHHASVTPVITKIESFVFCDPPYVLSTRTGRIYKHELSDADHQRLIGTVSRIDAAEYSVMLCGYWSPLYSPLLLWQVDQHKVMTRGGLRTEHVWKNYVPHRLHDYRFIGRDRRHRERIQRRQRTVIQSLARMSTDERLAMLQAIGDGFGQPPPADSFRGDTSRFASPSPPDPTAIHQ